MAEPQPRLLLIETSGRVGRVALAEGPSLLAEHSLDEARRHARDLAPAITRLLAQHGWRARAVHGVIVSLGPGSYTGLRVGIISAKALAYATGCGLVGVPSFEVLARQFESTAVELAVIADAQREQLYVQRFARASTDRPFMPAGEMTIALGRDWAQEHPAELPVTGPGLRIASDWLPASTPKVVSEPSLAGLLAVGWERFSAGVRDDPATLDPLYSRRSSAELQWDRRPTDSITACRSEQSS